MTAPFPATERAPTTPCAHERTIRKFAGAILCADCGAEVGDWRVEEGVERVVLHAERRPEADPDE